MSLTDLLKTMQLMRACGLTLIQMEVLVAVKVKGPKVCMTDLADGSGKALASLTGIVDKLSESGFVTRNHAPDDRRTVLVALTNKGADVVSRLDKSLSTNKSVVPASVN